MARIFILIALIFIGCRTADTYSNIDYPKGGYAYPLVGSDSEFYCYPLKDSMRKIDSFSMAYFGRFTCPAFNEENLSVGSVGEDVFRFMARSAFGQIIFIVIRRSEIIIKTNGKEYPYLSAFPDQDTTKLNARERLHYEILDRWFPIQEKRIGRRSVTQHYLDSLIQLYPELLLSTYYQQLIEKTLVEKKEQFIYTENRISISEKEFLKWVKLLNNSSYWQMSYNMPCNRTDIADGVFYSLEANTRDRYNYVQWESCPGDTSGFYQTCDALVKLAQIEDQIKVVWKE